MLSASSLKISITRTAINRLEKWTRTENLWGWVFPGGFPEVPARINGPWVEQTADELGVARIVVIGQLQHRGRLDWRTTLAKER